MSIKGRLSRKKTAVYQFLINHPLLDALQYALRSYKDKGKLHRIAGRDGLVLKCHAYGNDNRDKCIYHISFGGARHGFFAQFRTLLKYLAYADRFGFYPVVEWSREIPYAEQDSIHGTYNPFEYYFSQPAGVSVEEMWTSYNVFQSEEIHVTDFFLDREIRGGEDGYLISEPFIDRLAGVMKKYIRLNDWTDAYMRREISVLLGGRKTIGVHVRGSDFKGGYNNHPTFVPVEEFLRAADNMMKNGRYEQVFLATDDVGAIKAFAKVFGDRLVYYGDVMRTEGEVSVAFCNSQRKNHKYLLGLEVLRDMLSLAACDGLVAGISQVSNCARIARKSYGRQYEDMVILDRGINHTGNNFVR
ncbi:O-fucosyltransferase family protein [Lachnospiraceae bacterium JLR.KK008]